MKRKIKKREGESLQNSLLLTLCWKRDATHHRCENCPKYHTWLSGTPVSWTFHIERMNLRAAEMAHPLEEIDYDTIAHFGFEKYIYFTYMMVLCSNSFLWDLMASHMPPFVSHSLEFSWSLNSSKEPSCISLARGSVYSFHFTLWTLLCLLTWCCNL